MSWLQVIVLTGAYFAGSEYLRRRSPARSAADRRVPTIEFKAPPRGRPGEHVVTLTLVVVLVAAALLQWLLPGVLSTFRRDAARIEAGEWWRLASTLFVQDGGAAGTAFNVVSLLMVGWVAEQIWGHRRWLIIFFGGGLLSETIAMRWQPIGGGNSVANFSLAGAILVMCVRRRTTTGVFLTAAAALVAGVVLALARDIHGAATLFGASAGVAFISLGPARRDVG
jgi:membrane associated rhomboid family serine protease